MIKLYRRAPDDPELIEYWEAWATGRRRVTLHKGEVGDIGLTAAVRVPRFGSTRKVIGAEVAEARAEGYAEFDARELTRLVVQSAASGVAETDLALAEKLEGICDEVLGWTGNGRCVGYDIGTDEILVENDVVLADTAVHSLVEALTEDGPAAFLIALRPPGGEPGLS